MLKELNKELKNQGYDTDFDEDGIYLPEYRIDIIQNSSHYIINPVDDEPVLANNTNQSLMIINDFAKAKLVGEELDENDYHYNKESARFFLLENEKIKIIDGRIYLYDDNGETSVFVDIPSVIGALQSKFLGEK